MRGQPAISWPSNVIDPADGGNVPESMLKIVLLPEPFGPIRPQNLALIDLEGHVVDGRETAETLY